MAFPGSFRFSLKHHLVIVNHQPTPEPLPPVEKGYILTATTVSSLRCHKGCILLLPLGLWFSSGGLDRLVRVLRLSVDNAYGGATV